MKFKKKNLSTLFVVGFCISSCTVLQINGMEKATNDLLETTQKLHQQLKKSKRGEYNEKHRGIEEKYKDHASTKDKKLDELKHIYKTKEFHEESMKIMDQLIEGCKKLKKKIDSISPKQIDN